MVRFRSGTGATRRSARASHSRKVRGRLASSNKCRLHGVKKSGACKKKPGPKK